MSATRWSARFGRERGGGPHDRGAPVVADEVRLLDAEVVEDGGHVDREERDRVRVYPVGLVARAVATLVVADDLVPGVDECRHLFGPQPFPGVGPTVHQ